MKHFPTFDYLYDSSIVPLTTSINLKMIKIEREQAHQSIDLSL